MELGWTFDGDGYITSPNGINVKLEELAVIKENSVTDIYGKPISILVLNTNLLDGHPVDYFLTIDKVPVTTVVENNMVKSNISLTNTTLDIVEASLAYKGQSTKITTSAVLAEQLPNVKFDDTFNVSCDAGVTTTVNLNTLLVNSETLDNPYAYEIVSLLANTYYLLDIIGSGESPAIEILYPDGTVFIPLTNIQDNLKIVLNPLVSGDYKFKMIKNTTKENTNPAKFAAPSICEIDVTNLNYGDYYTITTPTGINTVITTKVRARDINYNINYKYNKDTNSVAFIKDSFTLLKYKADIDGLVGYVYKPDTTLYKEFFIDTVTNTYVGDFNNVKDLDHFDITAINATKELSGEALLVKRVNNKNIAELSFTNTTEVGSIKLFEFYIREIVGNWCVTVGSVELPIILTGDGITDRDRTFRFIYHVTSGVTTFKLRCKSLDTSSYIKISSLHGYEIDTNIWEDITPVTNNTFTNTFDINSMDMVITPMKNNTTVAMYSSIFGVCRQAVSGSGVLTRNNSLIKIEDNRITLGNHDVGCNEKDIDHNISITTMNKVVMYRDNKGTLSLIAFDSVSGYSSILTNITNNVVQTIPHFLNNKPISVSKIPVTYNDDIVTYLRTDDSHDRNYVYKPYKTDAPKDICNKEDKLAIFTDKSFSVFEQDISTGFVYYKCIAPTEYNKLVTYKGNISAVNIPFKYKINSLDIIPIGYDSSKTTLMSTIGYYRLLEGNNVVNNNKIFINGNDVVIADTDNEQGTVNDKNRSKFIIFIKGMLDPNYHSISLVRTKVTTKLTGDSMIVLNNKRLDGTTNNIAIPLKPTIVENLTKVNLR